jgi:hypothetical protein
VDREATTTRGTAAIRTLEVAGGGVNAAAVTDVAVAAARADSEAEAATLNEVGTTAARLPTATVAATTSTT